MPSLGLGGGGTDALHQKKMNSREMTCYTSAPMMAQEWYNTANRTCRSPASSASRKRARRWRQTLTELSRLKVNNYLKKNTDDYFWTGLQLQLQLYTVHTSENNDRKLFERPSWDWLGLVETGWPEDLKNNSPNFSKSSPQGKNI
jgi:hypothetical protein